MTGEIELMGDDDERAAFFGQFLDDGQHFAHQFRVERGGWFIKENDVGIGCDGSGNADTLLLTARELTRVVIRAVAHADFFKTFPPNALGLGGGKLVYDAKPFGDVFECGEVAKEVVVLKDKTRLAADAGCIPVTHLREVEHLALEIHFAAVSGFKKVGNSEERCLSGPRRTKDGDHIALRHTEADIFEHFGAAERLLYILEFKHLWGPSLIVVVLEFLFAPNLNARQDRCEGEVDNGRFQVKPERLICAGGDALRAHEHFINRN